MFLSYFSLFRFLQRCVKKVICCIMGYSLLLHLAQQSCNEGFV